MWKRTIAAALVFLFLGVFSSGKSTAQNLDIWCVWADNTGTVTCVAVRGPNGIFVLLDETGSADHAKEFYNDILVPEGVSFVDYAIAGHYDADHIGGFDVLVGLMGGCSAFGTFYDRGGTTRDDGEPIQDDYLSLVSSSGKRATPSLDGTSDIDLGNGAVLRFLSMGAPDTAPELFIRGRPSVTSGISENNKSISALITYGGFDFYFGSDLEGTGEKAVDDVVTEDLGRDVDILLVDHHGSDTNDISSLEFLEKMDPEIAVIAVGRNGHGHPRKETVERLQKVVEPLPQRIIRLAPGDEESADWAPEDMSFCHTVNRHLFITTDGTTYTVDTVDREGGVDIKEPGLVDHFADQGSHIPTATPEPTPTPSPTPIPWNLKVTLNDSSFRAGEILSVNVFFKDTFVDWDGYLVFVGDREIYSVVGNGIEPGIRPYAANMIERHYPYEGRVFSMIVPFGISGGYKLMAAILPAGTEPTVTNTRNPFAQLSTAGFTVLNKGLPLP